MCHFAGNQVDSNAIDYGSFFRAVYRPPPPSAGDGGEREGGRDSESTAGGDGGDDNAFNPGQHSDLLPRLYGFQARAAAWAVRRERKLTESMVPVRVVSSWCRERVCTACAGVSKAVTRGQYPADTFSGEGVDFYETHGR